MKVCGQAIDLNELLIKPDQAAYHEDMKERYATLKTKIAGYVGPVSPVLRIYPVTCKINKKHLFRRVSFIETTHAQASQPQRLVDFARRLILKFC